MLIIKRQACTLKCLKGNVTVDMGDIWYRVYTCYVCGNSMCLLPYYYGHSNRMIVSGG